MATLKISKRKEVLVHIEVEKKENWADVKSQLGAEPLIWVTKAGWGDEGMKAGDDFDAEPSDAAWLLNHYGLARSGPTCPLYLKKSAIQPKTEVEIEEAVSDEVPEVNTFPGSGKRGRPRKS